MSGAYYNEIDPYAAQWLRNLIKAGHIAPGDVDERSIEDVTPNELRRYTQCHFFAGIGVWSYGMRLAGWSDDRPAWTGSCPCQPFSAAGKGGGFDDERHLWPAWFWLINELRPNIIFGEQVASKDANPWFDLVRTDLEGLEYAVAGVPFPAASVGAPHIRDRLYWLANADGARLLSSTHAGIYRGEESAGSRHGELERFGSISGLANAEGFGRRFFNSANYRPTNAQSDALADPNNCSFDRTGQFTEQPTDTTNGFWRDADWLLCRDEKWRPVEPGTFPLANGAPARVGRLRAYGNAINAQQEKVFVECAMELL